jgi:hypothetical protein
VKKENVPIIKTKTKSEKKEKEEKVEKQVPNSFSKLISRESEPCFVERIDKIDRIKRNSSKLCSSISHNSLDSNEDQFQPKPARPESAKKSMPSNL